MHFLDRKNFKYIYILLAAIVIITILVPISDTNAVTDAEKKAALEGQISQLEGEISGINGNLDETKNQASTLSQQVATYNSQIREKFLELEALNLAIQQENLDIASTTDSITSLNNHINNDRQALGNSLNILNQTESQSPVATLLQGSDISDFFSNLYHLTLLQNGIEANLVDLRTSINALQDRKDALLSVQQQKQDLKALTGIEKQSLDQQKQQKDQLLSLTKGKEALYQQLLNVKQSNLAKLKTQLSYLEKSGISAQDAVSAAELAAQKTGIDPAFLLALLEVETGKAFEDGVITAGTHLGNGNWYTDLYRCYINMGKPGIAEAEKSAYFQITSSLGLDPNAMPVSRKPNYGCGGAMGPAQFLPTTWLRFSSQVAQLTGDQNPNPWNLEDAFTAAAIFLSQSGARTNTTSGEARAARTYISGNPNCRQYICTFYANKILSLTQEIASIL